MADGIGPTLRKVALDDRYDLSHTRIFTSGIQALVRLCLMQKERDRRAGLNTAGYVSGYRGSPLGGLDQQFGRAKRYLEKADVLFQPGLNEDLAATAVWGTQQAELRGEGRFDGVFSMWYGKGPGVDRSGDVFRHANFAGTSKHGGVLALMGDDHTAESSTTAHQSEFHLLDAMMPILNPAGVQELLDYGQHGFAMSRYSGLWVGLKCLKDTVESTGSIEAGLDRVSIVLPGDAEFKTPPGGLNIRLKDQILEQEARLHDHKRAAAVAYLRANKLDRMIFRGGPAPKVGVITVGKAYLDVRQALDELGIDEVKAADLGLRLFKVAAPWPCVPENIVDFAQGLATIIVVEEKRSLVEVQVREEMYGRANAPVLVGKRDENGDWLFPVKGALDPNMIAIGIAERLLKVSPDEGVAARLANIRAFEARRAEQTDMAARTPYFCSGCPHNSSTKVPDGMRAYAGIGCHYMVQWMDRSTEGFTQMGGEGANWIGEAPFSKRPHVFQNLGDGTYNHSGYLAIRAAKAAGVNITYKILFNDAVAMTGGQRHDGGLTVADIAAQVRAEGIDRIAIVADDVEKYPPGTSFPAHASLHPREDLEGVQRELATVPGVSVLIYDQTCAAEKRRRRKRKEYPDPDQRILINELVCEGCGDCGVKSNCVSVAPLATEFGTKRAIDQSSCNKDFSCVNGFCPSFVTVHGARIKKADAVAKGGGDGWGALPAPRLPALEGSYAVLVTGIGGTGVVTIGQIIGMAAHLEGKGCGVIDMAGLAQKGGAVYVHVRVAEKPETIQAIRVPAGGADLVIGGDLVVTGSSKVLAAIRPGETAVVVNTEETMTGDFTRSADFSLPFERLKRKIGTETKKRAVFVPATAWATALFGNSIATNMFLMGHAWQMGAIPLSEAALLEAIRINGEAVEMNQQAFLWGRRAAVDRARIAAMLDAAKPRTDAQRLSETLDETVSRRVEFLTGYQDAAYAARYRARVDAVRALETRVKPGSEELTEAVARYLFKLMAYKDEYEVARLYTDGAFLKQLGMQFSAHEKLEFHLAPPLLAKIDPVTGHPRKMTFGPWMMKAFGVLARMKGLRGTRLDVFGYTDERKTERRLIAEYEAMLDEFAKSLDAGRLPTAVALARIPEKIRGFGHVKERHLKAADGERAALLGAYRAGAAPALPIAAE
jgi:indolepyruvate ferredoxin oxidoreductase